MHFQKKLGKGMFGGEGFIMQRLSGNGTAFVEIDGHAVEYDLSAGQEILISTGYLSGNGRNLHYGCCNCKRSKKYADWRRRYF